MQLTESELSHSARLLAYVKTFRIGTGLGISPEDVLQEVFMRWLKAENMVQAVWFYARAWNFAGPQYKGPIETKMKYYYTKYHGNTDGLDAVKTQAAATLFPSVDIKIDPAKTPEQIVHDLMGTDQGSEHFGFERQGVYPGKRQPGRCRQALGDHEG